MFCLVRIDLLDVWQTSVPTDHSKFRYISQTFQRNPILGYHRDMYVTKYIEKNEYTEKNDQIGNIVSDLANYTLTFVKYVIIHSQIEIYF